MADYRERLLDLLEEKIGTRDVMPLDYHDIDDQTELSDLDFNNVIGSVSLIEKRVSLPSEDNALIDKCISSVLP